MKLSIFKYLLVLTVAILVAFKSAAQETSVPYKHRFDSFIKTREVHIQPFKTIPDYRIGDQLPDFGALKLINTKASTINLSDYRDRLLILDFWATNCGSCIEALPHMDALQKEFGDKIKIQPVTVESQDYIREWWKKNKKTSPLAISSAVEAFSLQSYFENNGIPHEIWVYEGKVIGITDGEYVDAYNIRQVLAGKIPNWPVKNDFYVADADKAFVKYAAISGCKEKNGVIFGYNNTVSRDPKNKTVGVSIVNASIYSAYALQWMKLIKFNELVVPAGFFEKADLWDVADKTKYKYEYGHKETYGYKGDWLRKHAICFKSVNPDTGQTDQQIALSVIADLNRLLGLNARWEKRKEKVLVLVRTTKEDKLKSKQEVILGDKYHNAPERENIKGNLHQFRGYNLGELVGVLNKQEENPYVFNETGYDGITDMDLNFSSWTDIAGIRKALSPYGLDLKEEERLVDRFVFTEVKNGVEAVVK